MIKCLLASLNSKFVDLNVCSVLNEFFFFYKYFNNYSWRMRNLFFFFFFFGEKGE